MPLRGKQNYHVTKLAGRAKLARLLLQRITEFKMNENQRKTPVVISRLLRKKAVVNSIIIESFVSFMPIHEDLLGGVPMSPV